MCEYDIHLADELAIVASGVAATQLTSVSQERMRLYLALLSLELSLKAMLERAGFAVPDIRKMNHGIKLLLSEIDRCTIEVDIRGGCVQRVPASRLRSVVISSGAEIGTVGQMVDRLDEVSTYPNKIRYGGHLRHFSSSLVANAARKTNDFAKLHWTSIQKRNN